MTCFSYSEINLAKIDDRSIIQKQIVSTYVSRWGGAFTISALSRTGPPIKTMSNKNKITQEKSETITKYHNNKISIHLYNDIPLTVNIFEG